MRKFLILFSVFIISNTAFAQDGRAKEILDKVSENAKSYNSIFAEFVFSLKNEEIEIDERNEGTIKIKGQKYCVNLPDLGVMVYSDGNTIWNYMEDGNQVTINNVDTEGGELMDPSSLFTIYQRNFESKFIKEENNSGKILYKIELFPNSEEYDVSKISININKKTMMIYSAVLYGTDGNLYGIEVNNMDTSNDFPDSDFIFDPSKYEDIEVIDWR